MSDTPPWVQEFRAALAAQKDVLRASLRAALDGLTPEERARVAQAMLDKMMPRPR